MVDEGQRVCGVFVKMRLSYLLQKNKEGDVGAKGGRQCALTGHQVKTFGRLDLALLPLGCVLHADSSWTVIWDDFSVAGKEKPSQD